MKFTLILTRGIGYTGKSGAPVWVARIQGIDAQKGFAREFLDAAKVERDHFGRARYTRTLTYEIMAPGLYESSAASERTYRCIYLHKDGTLHSRVVDVDRATEIARLMTTGSSYTEARRATRPAEVKA